MLVNAAEQALAQHLGAISSALLLIEDQFSDDGQELVAALDAASEKLDSIDGLLSEVEQAREALHSRLTEIGMAVQAKAAELEALMQDVDAHAQAIVASASAAFEQLETSAQTKLEACLNHVTELTKAAEHVFSDTLKAADAGALALREHAIEKRLDGLHRAATAALEELDGALAALEQSGVEAASDVTETLKSITGRIDGIVDVIAAIKPVLDTAAAIA